MFFYYADDIIILATIKHEAQQMLKIIERYGNEYEIKFNVGKTYSMAFNQRQKRSRKEEQKDNVQNELMVM